MFLGHWVPGLIIIGRQLLDKGICQLLVARGIPPQAPQAHASLAAQLLKLLRHQGLHRHIIELNLQAQLSCQDRHLPLDVSATQVIPRVRPSTHTEDLTT